ncbi:MAG TPA: exodeoxyribonuclease V subunit gamma, partial [Isosphaeraceae bacterium]|nr:exodeoxyribonuclease V subunit gamma [Isosphaeraceae bacterium]
MSSVLYLSTDIEALAATFAERLDEQGRDGGFFTPATVVVPNRYLEKWLKLRLAKQRGVVANLKFEFLEDSIWRLLQELDSRTHDPPLDLVSDPEYRLMVLAALLEERPGDADLGPLRSYLRESGATAGRDYWRKAWQLAARLASLVRDYEYHRQQELIRKWLGLDATKPASRRKEPPSDLERSQRALFLRIVDETDGLRVRLGKAKGKTCKTLPQYVGELHDIEKTIRKPETPSTVHLFGITQISSLHAHTLRWLGQWHNLRLYHANPLVGHLDALPSQSADAREALREFAARFRDPRSASPTVAGDELLSAWGRAAAEGLSLMAELLDGKKPFKVERVPAAQPQAEACVLGRLQDALLNRRESIEPLAQDLSLQVVACPSVEREVETVYQSILHNLRIDESLQQTDIAVLVTEPERYWPVIRAVFDRPPARISYNLAGACGGASSSYGHAVLGLLDLALESFSRTRVFETLLNPCYLAKLGMDRAQTARWLEWAEALGVYNAWDQADKRARGYSDTQLYSWKLGLRRLRLGRLMEVTDERAGGPAPRYKDVIPFADLASSDMAELDLFTRALEGLLPRLAALRSRRAGGAAWSQDLRQLCDDLLAPPPDRPREQKVRESLFESLENLARLDELMPPGDGVPLALVREFVAEQLQSFSMNTGEPLTGGVTIAAPSTLLPIPFQIVYMVGLGEAHFPGSDLRSSLDLRAHHRLPGDIQPSEANRLLFLQALLAARKKIYLSYNCRDLQKDQELFACGPINQLRRFIEAQLLDNK